MTAINSNRGYTSPSAQAVEQTTGKALAQSEPPAKPDSVALKPFLSKTVSVLTQGIKLGLSLVIQGSLKIAKFTAAALLKVGKAFVAAVKAASENKKTAERKAFSLRRLSKMMFRPLKSPIRITQILRRVVLP